MADCSGGTHKYLEVCRLRKVGMRGGEGCQRVFDEGFHVCTTHMCMMSVSCRGSCLTCGLTMAGWGIPVAWGPGGPGTMWCENLQ